MDISVQFLGAASEVTGSKFLLNIGNFKLLIDCGLFQGRKELRSLNRDEFPISPSDINAVVLTHAHLDHTGYLPKLFKDGYKGPVYCTTATADLMHLILMDSAKIQMEDAKYAQKKGLKPEEDDDADPLYTPDDVLLMEDYLRTTTFNQSVEIAPHISASFYNAGHVLGAAIVELKIKGDQEIKTIVFSGDLGRNNDPILFPPQIMKHADVLFVESTYGNRVNEATGREEIIEMMNEVFDRDGNILIPAFSIGRTQNLLMYLKNVLTTREIPAVRIVVDSPMAISATEFYRKHKDYHKLRGVDLDSDESFINLRKNLVVARTVEESKRVNEYTSDTIIISGSGMMTGGRVLHHLANRLPDPKNVIMISGYQAEGSRGRRLQQGAKTIRIYGRDVEVKAKVFTINGLSAHADRNELLQWLDGFEQPPALTFVVHGESESAAALAETLMVKGWKAHIPNYRESLDIFKNI